jgi:hypothetical protein
MWHVGLDLHRKMVVIAAVHDSGEVRPPVRLQNSEVERIKETFRHLPRSGQSWRPPARTDGSSSW